MSCSDGRFSEIATECAVISMISDEVSFENCWVAVLAFLNPHNLTKYAVLSVASRSHTSHDLLWAPYMEEVVDGEAVEPQDGDKTIKAVSIAGLKTCFLERKRTLCMECRAPTRYFFPLLKMRLCPKCESEAQTSQGSPYELCSKTDAKQMFCLERFDLNNLPSIKRNSPWATKSTELRLFLRSDVEACAVKKFGGVKELMEERHRRKEENRMCGASGGEVKRSEYEVRLSRRTKLLAPSMPVPRTELPSCSESDNEKALMSGSDINSNVPCSNSCTSEHCTSESRSDTPESHGDSGGEEVGTKAVTQKGERPVRELRSCGRPEPLGAVLDTSAPHFVRSVVADSLAARRFGVQVGDRLIAISGRSVTAFKRGWPEIKAAIARRPVSLRFERVYHKYQQGAFGPHRGGKGRPVQQRSGTDSSSAAGSSGAVQASGCTSPSRRQSISTVVKRESSWAKNRLWQEVDYLAMGISGLEVRD